MSKPSLLVCCVSVTNINENVRHTHSESLSVFEVNAFVGSMRIRMRSQQSQSDNESLWIQASKLGQEWNGTSHTIATVVSSFIEMLRSAVDALVQPRLRLFHAPAVTVVVSLDFHFTVVWNVFSKFCPNSIRCNLTVHVWRQAVTQSYGG